MVRHPQYSCVMSTEPVAVVEALQLKEGEEIEISITGSRTLQVGRTQDLDRLLQKLRKYRGQLPADFRFDRLEANARTPARKSRMTSKNRAKLTMHQSTAASIALATAAASAEGAGNFASACGMPSPAKRQRVRP